MDSVFQLFERVENKHGWMLVSHALSYITATKNGVSEPEIEDFISLDDRVLDDIYQYHLPPTRRIPPLLWTRVRSDLPGYLADSEADGVCVINWYHKQFKMAAKERYFTSDDDYLYFHSYMSDYFLGTYGGGINKPFHYTEIQKHMFRLKSKDSTADRQVPAQPLSYSNKLGKLTRYNLRKFSELPFQLVRCYRYKDLYDHVLFNYNWLFAKMCALPLHEVLGDFEDAVQNIRDNYVKEINLVADSIRLGGAILKHYPEMLASQLLGRLLPERRHCSNIRRLLQQCDEEGIKQNALVPTFHCMHTPGGPLKYSMEGHQFAIFAMKMTSDNRYIVSVSNKFITFDVVTSDLARQVYPGVEGLMVDLELSADNKFAAAYTNNNQTILLNTLIGEFVIINNPFAKDAKEAGVQGLVLVDGRLVICGRRSWLYYDMSGNLLGSEENNNNNNNNDEENKSNCKEILCLKMKTLTDFCKVSWTGIASDPRIELQRCQDGKRGRPLLAHTAVTLNQAQSKAFLCDTSKSFAVSEYELDGLDWKKVQCLGDTTDEVVMLALSTDERWCIATTLKGFRLWNLQEVLMRTREEQLRIREKKLRTQEMPQEQERVTYKTLWLPPAVRNVPKKFGQSSSLILSAGDK